MARKKAQKKKQETTLVPHRTPNLSALLEEAKSGDAAQAVHAYLHAGGSADALVHGEGAAAEHHISLLHNMALYNRHPHTELAGPAGDDRPALSSAGDRSCCTKVLQAYLQNGADVKVRSHAKGITALHQAAGTPGTI
jgi:hypothetical protein